MENKELLKDQTLQRLIKSKNETLGAGANFLFISKQIKKGDQFLGRTAEMLLHLV